MEWILNMLFLEDVARLAHNVNKAYCESIGDMSQVAWEDAPEWQKKSARDGVMFHINNNVTPEQSHENWMKARLEDGWVYGEVKDQEKKTHPCLVPYAELPPAQRTKDYLFKGVVDSFKAETGFRL